MDTQDKKVRKDSKDSKIIWKALDLILVPGSFYRFNKKAEKYHKEHYNIQPKTGDKIVKYTVVPIVEILRVAAYASATYGVYIDLFK